MKIDLTEEEINALKWLLGGGYTGNGYSKYKAHRTLERTIERHILGKLEQVEIQITMDKMWDDLQECKIRKGVTMNQIKMCKNCSELADKNSNYCKICNSRFRQMSIEDNEEYEDEDEEYKNDFD